MVCETINITPAVGVDIMGAWHDVMVGGRYFNKHRISTTFTIAATQYV